MTSKNKKRLIIFAVIGVVIYFFRGMIAQIIEKVKATLAPKK